MPTLATNKKARHDYEILTTYEAGLMLTGPEAKSLRNGGGKLTGAYVTFHKGDPMITGMHVRKYKYATVPDYDPTRSRKLLLHTKEIAKLYGKSQEKGLTIVPLSVYTKGRYIKVEIAVCRGKKLHDKREALKKRDSDKQVRRAIKGDY